MARLLVVSSVLQGNRFELTEEFITIGRSPDNIILLDHTSVSKHHAMITLEGDDYKLWDLHSTNGTHVNGKRIVIAHLRNNDEIQLGDVVLQFERAEKKHTQPLVAEAAEAPKMAPGPTVPAHAAVPTPSPEPERIPVPEKPVATEPKPPQPVAVGTTVAAPPAPAIKLPAPEVPPLKSLPSPHPEPAAPAKVEATDVSPAKSATTTATKAPEADAKKLVPTPQTEWMTVVPAIPPPKSKSPTAANAPARQARKLPYVIISAVGLAILLVGYALDSHPLEFIGWLAATVGLLCVFVAPQPLPKRR